MNKSSLQYLLHPSRLLVRMDQKGIIYLKDEKYLKWLFKWRLGYVLNLENPKTFNEKIQWLKLYDKQDKYTSFVDKYEVKNLVGSIIGDEYIIPTLGVWDTFDEIDFESLPERFVLKTTHDSGGIVIVKEKNKFDKIKAKEKLEKSLMRDYFKEGREWPYKNVKRRIIAEQFIETKDSGELIDYKLMLFNGKVRCSFTCTERFTGDGLKVTFFDRNWERLQFERKYPQSHAEIPKPSNYNLMVELAEELAKGIKFVRVDFYDIDGKIYFGEMTFFPGNGMEKFRPISWDYKLGEWINLNK